jgi:RimJ/RimL family protein N-acetyltransferase
MTETGDITFRPATGEDVPLIQDLSARIWREHYPGIITHEQIDYMLGTMYATEVMRDEIENEGYRYVIVAEGIMPIGYIAYRHEEKTRAVMISKLYLLPPFHGKGIGRTMLSHVKDYALKTGAQTLSLFVNKNNGKAIAAYERFGFVKAGAVMSDIGSGFVMDDFRMVFDLPLQ